MVPVIRSHLRENSLPVRYLRCSSVECPSDQKEEQQMT
jgi:hypothetical protein